ncbi:fungal-specific transcription factor domain-containing protein [Microdochium trichocladiopsis]|uniref:Fungal-specific transcription factor domain-containing protein n=1 Tax=Microdochium trichocladiopsis TaxID=1682393 RepID=A0A9P8YC04_9PEZI|nr:fungal-specific transcription factor domain-containing protein [Microdochium trichocladiopsis]KAH7035601.1 fungal-specific transcription factor domain-containing protein [Microdochium trichocladiopsis]
MSAAAGLPFSHPRATAAAAAATAVRSPGDVTSSGMSPADGSVVYATPDSARSAVQPYIVAKLEPTEDGDEDLATETSPGGSYAGAAGNTSTTGPSESGEPDRKKQKRNKPTLSCLECVERKTKCDRGRPHCLACIKRQSECRYAHVANVLEGTSRAVTNGRRMTRPPKKRSSFSLHSNGATADRPPLPNIADRGVLTSTIVSSGSVALSTGLLSNVPFSLPSASKVFGIGSGYPFANYWTCEGGLPEVISVLPEKVQSDMLVAQYFECVDPVYPCVHRQTFYAVYEHFWSLPRAEKDKADASFVALLFVMLALGTQFVSTTKSTQDDRRQMAEFYASAGNQALRMFSYMSTASIQSIQAMVLLCYFLINDNHASDGWAFAGLLMRQAYAMGLHRDPNIVTPHANAFEKQQRRKLWQAVLLQDTFFVVLLSLPPNATHTDVHVDDFDDDESSIANSDPTDTAYIRGSWTLANLVQETICSPRSLDLPICSTQRQKSKLVGDFRGVYRSFPDVFRSWNQDSIAHLAVTNKRVVRQTLFLTSNYYHNLMLVHASESPEVPINIKATLEAAHEAITAFFTFFALLPEESRVWWVLNHRAFLEALCIGGILKEVRRLGAEAGGDQQQQQQQQGSGGGGGDADGEGEVKLGREGVFLGRRGSSISVGGRKNSSSTAGGSDAAAAGDIEQLLSREPLYTRARADITRMMEIMEIMGSGAQGSEVARTRVTVLRELL